MTSRARQIYIISDLHIGGEYPAPGDTGRGFRICTQVPLLTRFINELVAFPTDGVELVINGDFVDFLAERHSGASAWLPYLSDPDIAARVFERIARRDAALFEALGKFVEKRHDLTILLGNHDVEMSFPKVRRKLCEAMGISDERQIRFIFDGEAYPVGQLLIEHGNRYDPWNMIDNDSLRHVRSLQSREQDVPDDVVVTPPPGSRLVSAVMNHIKEQYPFVDLLKPENEGMVPTLLALDPAARRELANIAYFAWAKSHNTLRAFATPVRVINAASSHPVAVFMDQPLGQLLGPPELADGPTRRRTVGAALPLQDWWSQGSGWLGLLAARRDGDRSGRLADLGKALKALRQDRSFDLAVEGAPEYLEAAKDLTRNLFKVVVFGHTHLPKDIDLSGGRRYLNTGTWADVMTFPRLDGLEPAAVLDALTSFVDDLEARRFTSWIRFRPSYAHVVIAPDGTITAAALKTYEPS